MQLKNLSTILVIVSFLASCQPGSMQRFDNIFTKENVGAATGAVGGAWIGSNVGKGKGNIAAIAIGTLLGAKLGQTVGKSLDKADMGYYNQASQNALERTRNGKTTTWVNPNNGHSGSITPVKTFQNPSGYHCREYSQTITINGKHEEAYGTACRNADGTWTIHN